MIRLFTLPFAIAAALALHAPAQRPVPQGFRYWDPGFEGRFEDPALNRLELASDGTTLRGTLHALRDWTVEATLRGDELVGRARAGLADEEFRARQAQDQVLVTISGQEYALSRTTEPDPVIADLGPVQPDPERRWTLAVYLGGDNDLELGAMLDLEELRSAMPEKGVEVIVLLDRAKGYLEEKDGWTDAHVFRVQHGSEGVPILKALGEIDTGDQRTLAGFLLGAFRTFPAQRNAAVIWNHGGGWTGIVQDEDVPGQPGKLDMLNHLDVRIALRTALWHAGRMQLDLLAFDACLMGELDVALNVREYANVLVSSEANVPGRGFPYQRVLPLLADAAKTPPDVARGIVDAFAESYEELRHPATTLSAVDLGRVDAVAQALDAFGAACLPSVDKHWPAIARALYYGEAYEPRTKREAQGVFGSRDLLDVLHRMRNGMQPFPAAKELAALEAELARYVLASRAGDARRLSHGVSIYAPYRGDQWMPMHETTPLGGASRWTELVRRVHAKAAEHAKEPVLFANVKVHGHGGKEGAPVRPFDGSRLTFSMAGRSVVAIEQWDCVRDGPGVAVLRKNWVPDPAWMARANQGASDEADLFMPVFADGKNELGIELTGLQYLVTNDELAVRATLDATAPAIDAPIVARAHMHAPGATEDVLVEVHFDRALWHAGEVIELPKPGSATAPRTVEPTPEHVFRFLIDTIGDDGAEDVVETPEVAWKKGLGLILDRDEPGEYESFLHAHTMDGRDYGTRVAYALEANPDLDEWVASWKDWSPKRMPATWNREIATGPGQWIDGGSTSKILASPEYAPGIFDVDTAWGPKEARETMRQLWIFDPRGIPNLRIVTPVEGDRKLCWYGPARFGADGDRSWVAMKAINLGGFVLRWKLSILDSLLVPTPEPK
ncbi:MAG: hypothetical protein IPJ77_23100 [Planctomycetes bacterium]|nr:hypothetical protein [Planctomycetota bacterium]